MTREELQNRLDDYARAFANFQSSDSAWEKRQAQNEMWVAKAELLAEYDRAGLPLLVVDDNMREYLRAYHVASAEYAQAATEKDNRRGWEECRSHAVDVITAMLQANPQLKRDALQSQEAQS